jgi:hypothetical protein
MIHDFTHKQYEKLLHTIYASSYICSTVYDYLTSPNKQSIIMRHDVDRAIERALKMAQIEHNFGIKATYYFRTVDDVFNPEIITEIADMGHEIGYHYETLDKAKGNVDEALHLFGQELSEFREIADVKTVCMHGNAFASWANRDIWNNYNFNDFGIIGEPYLSIDYNNVLYLTDTGRTWAGAKVSVKDVVQTSYDQKTSTTDGVIDLIKSERFSHMCLVVHPHRWCDNYVSWLWELVWQNTKNVGKRGIVLYRKNW